MLVCARTGWRRSERWPRHRPSVAELASAADVLGPTHVKMQDCADGALREVPQARLVAQVVAAADSCFPDGLLVFDTGLLSGRRNHVTATCAGLAAAETLSLPVLGWALSEAVATRLKLEFGAGLTADHGEEVDLRVTIQRARQRFASHALQSSALPSRARWRRLELLADTGSVRWLRAPGGGAGYPETEPGHAARA
jgi:LmbE family N-acetylglucosaminyl deacetylase